MEEGGGAVPPLEARGLASAQTPVAQACVTRASVVGEEDLQGGWWVWVGGE